MNFLTGPLCLVFTMTQILVAADIQCLESMGGSSRCVVVGPSPLAHTAQIFGLSPQGIAGSVADQIEKLLEATHRSLQSRGSSLDQAVKLNIYVAEDELVKVVETALASRFSGKHKPAVSFVTTALPVEAAVVAMDAIGVVHEINVSNDPQIEAAKSCSVLPVGPRVYVSGQAEKGDGTVVDATQQTLASLGRTLDFLGLSKKDIIQVKSFLGPMSKHNEAESAIAAFFGNLPIPPCVFVEWESTLPIEIELIATGASNPALVHGPPVEVRTPPGMTTPTVYSRLTIARHTTAIYTSGLYPTDASVSAESQLRSLFTNLKQTLDISGSDWMHLVKATYYVNDDALNKWHNTVRPDYFSPRLPPAASKANVRDVGRIGHGIMMDFIVVPGNP